MGGWQVTASWTPASGARRSAGWRPNGSTCWSSGVASPGQGRPWTPPPAACGCPWSRPATWPRAPPAGRASGSTAASGTSHSLTSRWPPSGAARSAGCLLGGPDGVGGAGARVRDEEAGGEITVAADGVVVCAGVWTDLVHELAGVRAGYRVRMSKGVHIVVPREAVRAETGIILRTEKSVLFFIPWGERWIVGTTDTDFSGDRAEPIATQADVDYILAAANRVLVRPLTRADVIAVFARLRPLVQAARAFTGSH